MSGAPDERERAYKLAYDEAVRALSQQQSVVDSFRARAGVLLSATVVATSFFGGQALTGPGELDALSWLAIALFGLVAVSLLAIMTPGRLRNLLRPGKPWEGLRGYAASPSLLIEGYIEAEPAASLADTYRDVALYMEQRWDEIEADLVRRLDVRFRVASLLLVVEIAAWAIDIS